MAANSLVIALLFAAFLVHPVHETVSEVEWNEKTHRLEVALRLDALDEQWLTTQWSEASSLDHTNLGKAKTKKNDWSVRYLADHFQISHTRRFDVSHDAAPKAKPPKYHWVGRKPEGAHVWWYFEIEPQTKKRPVWIRQRMFFERDDRYTNRVIVLDQTPRLALTLSVNQSIARMDRDEEQPRVGNARKEDVRQEPAS